jgi:hypothetical protein
MTRRQWTGLAGVLFGALMLAGILTSGTTPDSSGAGAVDRYTKHWSDSGQQDRAVIGSIVLLYAWVLLACFAAGLRQLLLALAESPLRSIVHGTGTAAAALFAVGGVMVNGAGVAAAESSGYQVDGNDALLLESVGYYVLTAGMMMGATMAVAFSVANRGARLVPAWTVVLTGLMAVVGLGAIFLAWAGFMLLPAWAVVMGLCLLLTRGPQAPASS